MTPVSSCRHLHHFTLCPTHQQDLVAFAKPVGLLTRLATFLKILKVFHLAHLLSFSLLDHQRLLDRNSVSIYG